MFYFTLGGGGGGGLDSPSVVGDVLARCCDVIAEIVCFSTGTRSSQQHLFNKKCFGITGPWCFIQSLNNGCEPSGKMMIQMTIYCTCSQKRQELIQALFNCLAN